MKNVLLILLFVCSISSIFGQSQTPINHPKVCIGLHSEDDLAPYVPYCNNINDPLQIYYGEAVIDSTIIEYSTEDGVFTDTFKTKFIYVDPNLFLSPFQENNLCIDGFDEVAVTVNVCVLYPPSGFEGVHGGIETDQDDCFKVKVKFCCPNDDGDLPDQMVQQPNHAFQSIDQQDQIKTMDKSSKMCEHSQGIIYPNPSNGMLWIAPQFDQLSIIDLNGAVVKTASRSNGDLMLDIMDVKSGIYYIVLVNGEDTTIEKIVRL